MDLPKKSNLLVKAIFFVISGALLFLLAADLGERFFVPEAGKISSMAIHKDLSSPADRMLAKPLLPALLAWMAPFRSFRLLWPFVCALAGTLLGASLLYPLKLSPHPRCSLLYLFLALLSVPFLFLLTADPGGALGLALLCVATTDMLVHLQTGRTYPLFSAGVALGFLPLAASWGFYVLLGVFLVNRLLVEVEEHGFLAEYIVLFTPFLLLGGGWWFLHWVYRKGEPLFPSPSFPLAEGASFPISGFLLLLTALLLLFSISCGKDRAGCVISFRFFFLAFLGLGVMWILLPWEEPRLRMILLSLGILLVFLGSVLHPLRNHLSLGLLLGLLCVGTWWELPRNSENLAFWKNALTGENAVSYLYPEEKEIGTFLRNELAGASVGLEGRAPMVEFLAGDTVRFVSVYEDPSAEFMLFPFFHIPGKEEDVLFRSPHWILLRRIRGVP
jgi:hypothetical protein